MPFIASTLSLQLGFDQLRSVALQQKTYLANWATRLNSNITALDAVEIVASVDRALQIMDSCTALPGMGAYAKQQFDNANYDLAAEFTTMRNALVAIRGWLKNNIPSGSITITNGVPVGNTFTPAQTAPLKTLVNAAAATIA